MEWFDTISNNITVRVETFGTGNTLHSAGLTTTVTTTSGTGSSASSGQDNVDTVLSVGVREESPGMLENVHMVKKKKKTC